MLWQEYLFFQTVEVYGKPEHNENNNFCNSVKWQQLCVSNVYIGIKYYELKVNTDYSKAFQGY